MINKQFILLVIVLSILTIAITDGAYTIRNKSQQSLQSDAIAIRKIGSSIAASGMIRSQNEASITFQTGGKLSYLPFKEGDTVYQGQIIAQLDSYVLQRQLQSALNAYRTTRNIFDQTKDNVANNIAQGQQKVSINSQNANPVNGDLQNTVVNDIVKRIVDENQANLDNSVIAVEITNYAMQLATLTSPINGIILHEDVTVPNVNITPATTFTIADPSALVFRANVSESDIDGIVVGSPASVQIDGMQGKTYPGTVTRIYPQKTTLPTGQQVYQVEITSAELQGLGKMQQSGSVLIQSSASTEGKLLVPIWTVLSHNAIWVMVNNTPVLKHITVGQIHGESIEILSGLNLSDTVIRNPEGIAAKHYHIL